MDGVESFLVNTGQLARKEDIVVLHASIFGWWFLKHTRKNDSQGNILGQHCWATLLSRAKEVK